MPTTDAEIHAANRNDALALVIGAAAPIIAVTLATLPPTINRPGMLTFAYQLSGVTVAPAATCDPADGTELLTTVAEVFGADGWGRSYVWNPSFTVLHSVRLTHPLDLTRTGHPTS